MQRIQRLISLVLGVICVAMMPVIGNAEHAISMHGAPKYPKDFSSFDYVNPQAPKGGMLTQGVVGFFDTFNPFVINGMAAAGIMLTHDTLMKQSLDESFSLYGLIAQSVHLESDGLGVSFCLNPQAVFSDGSQITTEDVIFSFEILRDKGVPTYRYYYADVEKVYASGDNCVVFRWKKGVNNRELPLILGELPILSKRYWSGRDFEKTSLDIPVSSGPYVVESVDGGRSVVYRFNPNYWAKDLNVNQGYYNFEKIKFDYYRDATVLGEAFKAGVIDVRQENEAKKWMSYASEPAVAEGKIIQREFVHRLPSGMQGFVFNIRRPVFADSRVRQALSFAFDFDWANQNLFHGLYTRTTSYFDNSSLKAPELPSEAELKLLNPWHFQLPPDLFVQSYRVPDTKTHTVRQNLKKALDLLGTAGWTVQDGVLKNEQGEPFEFTILLDAASAPTWERVLLPFVGRLKRLGITAYIQVVDIVQYKNRLDHFDYDMIVHVWGQSLSPGNEQRYFWGSEAADTIGSMNYAGIQSPVVDALIDAIIQSQSESELQTAVHALDRVLLWSYLVIPHWYSPVFRYLYWDKFGVPDITPLKGISVLTWWYK